MSILPELSKKDILNELVGNWMTWLKQNRPSWPGSQLEFTDLA